MSLLKKFLSYLIIYFFNSFPIKKNKVFLFSYYGSQYGCNPKYITEYMLQHNNSKFDVVWAFNDPEAYNLDPRIRKVKVMSIKYFYELCTSKIIITNFRTTDLFVKRKKQYYIQTWHSSMRLKQIEKDAEETLPEHYVKMAKRDSKQCDLLLSGCENSTDIFRRAYWYNGEIFKHGTPRNDLLFGGRSGSDLVKQNLNLSDNTKVLFYAPTFRRKNDTSVYDLDYQQLRQSLTQRFGGEWTILVKFHPHLLSLKGERMGEGVINVTDYSDIQELLFISDALITDYSSLMFDYAITKRPCFLYVPDLEEYMRKDRKLYFNVVELPFVKAASNHELAKRIEKFNEKHYQEELILFLDEIGSYEQGQASEQVVKQMEEICFSEKRGEIYEAI
ncbi:CDP-glycerol glycerophosphotransferase family protein [Halobacillus sp. A5]|uniref:CDP-glycerol glycerophosphotransferase family protein n=1 Tax=Halobacillus sp. A5 TaxID=2880263 RepID=UPI0020A6930C|nr:CDP-glycerol glycerophosphotransferase family protein [Halobacillus sp. A5]MCP3029192.1 CDP-glycerol glycerophosphotransferase family protein [Halobacillus sp. A5]